MGPGSFNKPSLREVSFGSFVLVGASAFRTLATGTSPSGGALLSSDVLSLFASFRFLQVYFLDWLQDLDSTDESADRAIGEVINAAWAYLEC